MGFIGIGLLLLGMMVAGIVLGKRYEFSRGFPLVASAASLVSIGAVYLVPEFWGKALLLGAVMCFWFATLFSSLYLFAVDPVGFARLRAQVLRNCPEKRRRMSRADRPCGLSARRKLSRQLCVCGMP